MLNAAAAWRHLRVISELQNGGGSFRKPSAMGIGLAVVLAVAGLAMVAHLMVMN